MSLKEEIVSLLRDSGLVSFQAQESGTNHEIITEIDEVANELEYTKVYKQLITQLDELVSFEYSNESDFDSIMEQFDVSHVDKTNHETLLEYLKDVQELKRLLIQNSMVTLPILRAVHHVEGIPSKETKLKDRIEKRDELSLSIIKLQKSIKNSQIKLQSLKLGNSDLLKDVKSLVSQIPKPEIRQDSRKVKALRAKLKEAKQKSFDISEEIQLLMVNNGINWVQDPELLNIIKLCGEVYHD